ncbi:purine-nucleoside phosphorylase [Tissierella creatinini]|nr:purine-nucleoside phosphorylase [Tissierella creatinini]TJX64354.1 purine-nucleoside phosphorylase [Soehngenia saccharolytica]
MEEFNYGYFKKSADYIQSKIGYKVDLALILGSCLGSLAEEIENPIVIDYKDIPNFLISTVESHAGKLIIGDLHGKKVVCMSGRFHYYEGYDFEQLVIPIRVFKLLGVETVILTNAAGAVNTSFKPEDIMIINDHIKLMGASPLRGPNLEEFGPRFNDMSKVYDRNLIFIAKKSAEKISLDIKEGVYYFCPGPQFETPAEIRAIRILGGDAVGMSTVTEAITASHCGIKVLGLSLITNMAAGILDQAITADEVDETATKSAMRFKELLREVLKEID